MSGDAGYVLVKGDQGLGNRILCLLSAILLARLTGRRLVVDWRDPFYSADGTDAFPLLFRSDLAVPLHELPETDSVRPAIWRGNLHASPRAMRRPAPGRQLWDDLSWEQFCVGLDRIDHPERILVFTCFVEQIEPLRRYLTGGLADLRRLSTDDLLRRLWTEHLGLAPELRERVRAFRRARFGEETLGVHVRASDRRTRVAAIEATTARLVARHPQLRVFLASDNADVVHRYTARFGEVITTEKWYPRPGERMHSPDAHPDPAAGAADALVDLHLLAECDRLVVDSRSSFGRLAALRSRAAPRGVVDLHPGRFVPAASRRLATRLRSRAVRLWRAVSS